VNYEELVRPDVLGPLLANATGDDHWLAMTASLITGGKSNLTFSISCDTGSMILRRPPSGELVSSAHDMGREVRIQRALEGSAVPVPRIIAYEATADLIGVPFYVMEKVEGHVIGNEMPPGYATTPEEKKEIADALVDVLVDLHSIEPSDVALADYGRPNGYIDRQMKRWSEQWSKLKTSDTKAVDELGRRLSAQIPSSNKSAIIHGDYRLDNCIMALNDPSRVNGVLDWELSTLGDALSDLGLLLFYWREPGEYVPMLIPSVTKGEGFPSKVHLAERYALRTNLPLDDLPFYVAFAHFKFAVIAQGILVRVQSDAMAGQNFGDLEVEVRMIAEEGLAGLS
jgi:aminoglycoside phosphotransferase (APT) family kinase protein